MFVDGEIVKTEEREKIIGKGKKRFPPPWGTGRIKERTKEETTRVYTNTLVVLVKES